MWVPARQVFCSFSEHMVPCCPKICIKPSRGHSSTCLESIIWALYSKAWSGKWTLDILDCAQIVDVVLIFKVNDEHNLEGLYIIKCDYQMLLLVIIILIVTILVQHLVISTSNLRFEMMFLESTILIKWAGFSWDSNPNGRNSLNELHAQEKTYTHWRLCFTTSTKKDK